MTVMSTWIFIAGLLHFCQVPAMALVEVSMLEWKKDLQRLQPINRRIVKVIGLAIILTVLGLGVVVMTAPGELIGGSTLGASLAAFLSVFWSYRLLVEVLVYPKVWPRTASGRIFHYALSVLFAFLAGTYTTAFIVALRA
jgi:hypothetical protein